MAQTIFHFLNLRRMNKKTFIKIIIYFFDKYAFDTWVEIQHKEEEERFKKQYNLKNKEEVYEMRMELQNEPQREAYYAGKEYGYEKAMEQRHFF